jgi:hypothetical protein
MFFQYATRALLWAAEVPLGRQLDRMDADIAAGLPVDMARYREINAQWESIVDARLDIDIEAAAVA